jgi:hypothetical protein
MSSAALLKNDAINPENDERLSRFALNMLKILSGMALQLIKTRALWRDIRV